MQKQRVVQKIEWLESVSCGCYDYMRLLLNIGEKPRTGFSLGDVFAFGTTDV